MERSITRKGASSAKSTAAVFEPAVVDHLGNDKDLIHRDRADTGHSDIENQRGKQQQDNQRQRRPDNSRQDS